MYSFRIHLTNGRFGDVDAVNFLGNRRRYAVTLTGYIDVLVVEGLITGDFNLGLSHYWQYPWLGRICPICWKKQYNFYQCHRMVSAVSG